jgi:thioredoxin-dependent peroxiredoxin
MGMRVATPPQGWDDAAMLRVGDKAPEFSGKDASGAPLALSSFAGQKNVVLYFYPRDFTPGCTKEACSFRDAWDELSGKDTVIIGVSRDDDASHREFASKHRLPFPLLADESGEISRSYGVLGGLRGLLGMPKRVTYVIDKHGIVRGVFHHELRVELHLDDVRRLLDGLS